MVEENSSLTSEKGEIDLGKYSNIGKGNFIKEYENNLREIAGDITKMDEELLRIRRELDDKSIGQIGRDIKQKEFKTALGKVMRRIPFLGGATSKDSYKTSAEYVSDVLSEHLAELEKMVNTDIPAYQEKFGQIREDTVVHVGELSEAIKAQKTRTEELKKTVEGKEKMLDTVSEADKARLSSELSEIENELTDAEIGYEIKRVELDQINKNLLPLIDACEKNLRERKRAVSVYLDATRSKIKAAESAKELIGSMDTVGKNLGDLIKGFELGTENLDKEIEIQLRKAEAMINGMPDYIKKAVVSEERISDIKKSTQSNRKTMREMAKKILQETER